MAQGNRSWGYTRIPGALANCNQVVGKLVIVMYLIIGGMRQKMGIIQLELIIILTIIVITIGSWDIAIVIDQTTSQKSNPT